MNVHSGADWLWYQLGPHEKRKRKNDPSQSLAAMRKVV